MKVFWYKTKKPLTEGEKKQWKWLIDLFQKKPHDCTDPERLAQEIYKNILIFSEMKKFTQVPPKGFHKQRTGPWGKSSVPTVTLDKGQWNLIIGYVLSQHDIDKHLCIGCGKGTLYDKKHKRYPITRKNTMEEITMLINEIRNVNAEVRNDTTNAAK